MPTRFVILHHKIDGGEHWDLMLERGGVLLTWQLWQEPVAPVSNRCELRVENPPHTGPCLPILATQIADHRKAYLDSEGPISGDRGHIRRLDAGTVEFKEFTAEKCLMMLQGDRFRGAYSLTRRSDGENEWVFEKVGRQ